MIDCFSFSYRAVLPATKAPEDWQLTTAQANNSRLVTMCRWVVEVVNGRFKRDFKLFRQDFFNRALSHAMEDFRIAGSIINAFHVPITDSRHAADFISIIQQRMNLQNSLADYILSENINRRRVNFSNISSVRSLELPFPRLNNDDLILFGLGTYQIKLARSYFSENIRDGGEFTIEVCRDDHLDNIRQYGISPHHAWLLRVRTRSRHCRSRIYYSYIIVSSLFAGRNAIQQWYCTCLSGRRTLGCCAHIMCVVWYLGWAQYEPEITLPAVELDNVIVE